MGKYSDSYFSKEFLKYIWICETAFCLNKLILIYIYVSSLKLALTKIFIPINFPTV